MKNDKDKEICPTCGQSMKLVKLEEQPKKLAEAKIDEDVNEKGFDISEIWHCLNCSEEWKIDLMKNIWRKNEIIK